jgi:hypothetical protein
MQLAQNADVGFSRLESKRSGVKNGTFYRKAV